MWTQIKFNNTNDWRYATSDEINLYNFENKPCLTYKVFPKSENKIINNYPLY